MSDEELPKVGPVLDLLAEAGRRNALEVVARLLAPRAQDREAAVARDRVDPGLEADRLVAPDDVGVCGDEGLLESVLRLVAGAEHVPAVREDGRVVAVVEHLERSLVAAPELGDQALVAERAEELPRARKYESAMRMGERVSLHIRIIGLKRRNRKPFP